jgi:hypothetical protein
MPHFAGGQVTLCRFVQKRVVEGAGMGVDPFEVSQAEDVLVRANTRDWRKEVAHFVTTSQVSPQPDSC